jgi:diaminopimelate epimerase
VAAAVVGVDWTGVMSGEKRPFYKMTGSGNDFVFFDVRHEPIDNGAARLADPARVRALCARGTGVGADGLVLVKSSPTAGVDASIA